jgi:hypothetical protein
LRDENLQKQLITTEEGEMLSQRIHANRFIECSALNNKRITDTIEESLRAAVHGPIQSFKREKNVSKDLCSCCQS